MKLKRISTSGFKSFADRLNLEFGDGITCIVGPNGCGKSNSSDAVRWVLGEQSPRALRVNRMQDLIFSGTSDRKPEGMTEVRVVFDNEDGSLSLPFAEIEVSRRLYRSGESEYFINKEAVRLKDITDLFANTGVGTHSYSLLEQGRVDAILKAKPNERREIFEEASGITKYRLRQDEALRKLKRVSQDLQRVEDIIGELSRQVRSLKIQAGKASRYNEMHLELHHKELVRLWKQKIQLDDKLAGLRQALEKAQELRQSLEDQLSKGAAASEEARKHVELTREGLIRFQGIKSELESENRRLDDQLSHCRAMESELTRQGEHTQELEKTLLMEKEEAESSIEARSEIEEKLRRELVEFEIEENLLAAQAAEGQSDYQQARKTAEQTHQQVTSSERTLDSLTREIEMLEREAGNLSERRKHLADQAQEAVQELEAVDAKITAAMTEHEDTRIDLDREEKSKAELTERLNELEREIAIERRENEKLHADRSRLNHRLESLHELQVQHEGQGEGIKQAFQRRSRGEEPFTALQGVLIEKIRVAPGCEDAIESAFSAWLQSAICGDASQAVSLLEALRKEGSGRLTCVLADVAQSKNSTRRPAAINTIQEKIPGALSALEIVDVEADYMGLVQPFLEKTIIVEDLGQLSSAIELLEEGWIAVTRQGEVAQYPGFISGGRVVTTGFLKRQSEIATLTQQLGELNALWQESEEKLQTLREGRRETSEELKACEGSIRDLVIRKAARHEEMQGLARLRTKIDKTLENTRAELERIDTQQVDLSQRKSSACEKRTQISDNLQNEQEAAHHAAGELQRIEGALRELQARHHRHRETTIAIKKDLERCQHEIQQSRQRHGHLEQRIAKLKVEEQEREGKIWEVLDRKSQAEEALKQLFEKVDRVEQDLAEQEANLAQMEERHRGIEEQVGQIRDMHQSRVEEIQRMELEGHRGTIELENIDRRLVEELQSDWQQCQKIAEEADEQEISLDLLSSDITGLREKISRMGEINPLAVEEYAEQKERLDFLTRQQDDLVKARGSLQRTIAEVTKSARKQFLDTFEQIRQNFNRTFRRIFGGGRADLMILNEANVLESGVEIFAQPPGKKLQSITPFSGGEKSMTAIALLFAIYQVKASPFCFLDEVDAALDDANVDRFARLLLDFKHQTQFIIVTHNKHTMAAADRLYGVTMDKPGVSTVVSMEFEHRSNYDLSPLPEVEDDPLPAYDYDAALATDENSEGGEVEPAAQEQAVEAGELVAAEASHLDEDVMEKPWPAGNEHTD